MSEENPIKAAAAARSNNVASAVGSVSKMGTKDEAKVEQAEQPAVVSPTLATPQPSQVPDEPTREYFYRLPIGATGYVCADGTKIVAAGGVITDWEDRHEKEFEANVRCGNWRKLPSSQLAEAAERARNSGIVTR